MLYFRVEPDIYDFFGIHEYPQVPERVNFIAGRFITESFPSPLVFEVDHPKGESPRHFLGKMIPVASDLLIATLRGAGVDNFQVFPAVLRSPETSSKWTGYTAFNVVGDVDAADLESCTYDEILAGGDGLPPLLDFEKLVFAGSKVRQLLMFRLLQNPTTMFIHEKVREHLFRREPAGGWGITTFEVPVR